MTHPPSSHSPTAPDRPADEVDRALWQRAIACAWLLNSILVELDPQKQPLTRLPDALHTLREHMTAAPLNEETVTVLEGELQSALVELESVRTLMDAGAREVTETLRTLWNRRAELRKHGAR